MRRQENFFCAMNNFFGGADAYETRCGDYGALR